MFTGARSLSFVLALLSASFGAIAADDAPARYEGRTVVSVIEEFRSQGFGFAYSSNLVGDDLLVTIEPSATDKIEIIRQILEPHDLTIRSEEGLWLIVRDDQAGRQAGHILLIVRDKRDYMPLERPTVNGTPALVPASVLAPGIQQYSELEPGTYRIEVTASGFDPAVRLVGVESAKTTAVTVLLEPARPEIESITVSASRYEISRDDITSIFFIDQRTIQNMPDLGEDPVRVTQRLPGTAAGGVSARAHFRGGEESETGIILNGQRLFDPFHVRDYQNIFSAIDARAIDGVEVYTGGFPVRYGDRLSGFVLMNSLDSMQPRHTELGISVFNTSILSAGTFTGGDSQWLASVRRSNLDIVLDPMHGRPSYYDMFGQVSFDLAPGARVALNGLYADDQVVVILESEPAELERARSETQNAQFWVTLDNQWAPALRSTSVLSVSSYANDRVGVTSDVEKVVSAVDDRRRVTQYGFRQDWFWNQSDIHLVQWGFQGEHSEARYAYTGEAEFFGYQALYENVADTISRDLSAEPVGNSFAVYISDRWKVARGTIVELGLRWDDQTYTGLVSDSQLSPRFNVLHALNPATEFRFSWGRYHQSQGIHELQIEDGVTDFYPAQRADHIIAGIRHKLDDRYSVRLELFQKDMSRLRPRFENLFDPLALIPELRPDRVRIAPTKAQASGLELSIDYSNEPLSWWASYTLSEVNDTVDGVKEPRSWDQRHALLAGLTWSNDIWDFSLAANVHSGWPTTEVTLIDAVGPAGEPTFIAIPGPRNASRHRTFASVDGRISRRFKVGKGTITAFFEVSNLFDRDNPCCLDYDLTDDADGNSVLERGEDYWLPRLPAIGFLWEFQ
ncbi:MAG: TonB-dependent receptor domain-containing protein [Woeseiaceae bacterium]